MNWIILCQKGKHYGKLGDVPKTTWHLVGLVSSREANQTSPETCLFCCSRFWLANSEKWLNFNLAVGGKSQTALETDRSISERQSLKTDWYTCSLRWDAVLLMLSNSWLTYIIGQQLAHIILTFVTQHYLNLCSIDLFSLEYLFKIAAISNIWSKIYWKNPKKF